MESFCCFREIASGWYQSEKCQTGPIDALFLCTVRGLKYSGLLTLEPIFHSRNDLRLEALKYARVELNILPGSPTLKSFPAYSFAAHERLPSTKVTTKHFNGYKNLREWHKLFVRVVII